MAPLPYSHSPGKNPLIKVSRAASGVAASIRRASSTRFAPGKRADAGTADQAKFVNIAAGGTLPNGAKLMAKPRLVNHGVLVNLSHADPVTWSIMAMQRRLITQTPWDIVPDINRAILELNRWEDQSCDCVNDWGYALEFETSILKADQVGRIQAELKSILPDPGKKAAPSSDGSSDSRKKRAQIASLFRVEKRVVEQAALVNASRVRGVFQRPNNDTETSLRALLELVVTDLQIDDAGVIIKNKNILGTRLAELWRPPGWQIMPIVFPDFTVPKPPHPAYVWQDSTEIKGWYSNQELTYMMANPQGNGYGMSPVETLIQVITASILGDNSFIKNMQEGFLPPGIINLKEATRTQRDQFSQTLDEQISKQSGNRLVVLSGAPTENGELQYIELPRGLDFQKLQVMKYMEMAPGIKALAFGFQSADLGLILQDVKGQAAAPDQLAMLSQRRAVTGPLLLMEEYFNAEIVKTEFAGTDDVMFQFEKQTGNAPDVLEEAQADSVLVAAGVMSRNDVRRRRKERPIPGGNVYTMATGNALIQVDSLETEDGDDPEDALVPGSTPPGTVPPTVDTGDAKKRNDANKKQQMKGHESRATTKSIQMPFMRVDSLEE